MSILKHFKKEMNQDVELYGKTQTLNTTTGNYTTTEGHIKTVKGFLYEGSGIEQFVSDKIKPLVDAIVLLDPQNITRAEIKDTDNITVDDRNFTIVRCKDVGNQGEVVQVYLKEKF